MTLHSQLKKRGFIKQTTNPKLFDEFENGWKYFYCGYDPTADSLHIGHMVTIMAAVNFMKKGNTFIMLIGGATGMIWDPSFKESERNFLDKKTLKHNQEAITQQVHQILQNLQKLTGQDFQFKVVNNYDFYKDMSILDFLTKVGKYITINTMIAKETIKKRIQDPDKSISFTEFSYTLLQGYDFLKLYQDEQVTLQLAWSDQRWNITTGTELIRKSLNQEVHGITIPLILASNGKKFWKSEWNAIRIDTNKNSPYVAYQYFMNTSDQDIPRFLKLFTLLEFDQIDQIVSTHNQSPEKRYGQTQLANYVIETIFGSEAKDQAQKISQILFSKNDKLSLIQQMSTQDTIALQKETGWISIPNQNIPKILDLCTTSQLTKSNWETKKLIQSGAISLNETKIQDIQYQPTTQDFINNTILLQKWKKSFKTILLT